MIDICKVNTAVMWMVNCISYMKKTRMHTLTTITGLNINYLYVFSQVNMAFNEENFGGDFDQLLRQHSLLEYHHHNHHLIVYAPLTYILFWTLAKKHTVIIWAPYHLHVF